MRLRWNDMKENTPIVILSHVYFSYNGLSVLEDVNIAVEERDFLSIIGPNGGGKTTILKLILGLLEPDKGSIQVFNTGPRLSRKKIGYLPQLFNFDFAFPINVIDVVLMGRLGKNHTRRSFSAQDIEIAHHSLKRVGLEEFQTRQIGELSGGQRQRVFIARALATEPKLLLLDEPVASVDATWQQNFFELLHELNKDLAIVMVTHDISAVVGYIDKIACVNKKLYYHGSKKDGIAKIAEMYECPVQLLAHEPFVGKDND